MDAGYADYLGKSESASGLMRRIFDMRRTVGIPGTLTVRPGETTQSPQAASRLKTASSPWQHSVGRSRAMFSGCASHENMNDSEEFDS